MSNFPLTETLSSFLFPKIIYWVKFLLPLNVLHGDIKKELRD